MLHRVLSMKNVLPSCYRVQTDSVTTLRYSLRI